MKLILPVLLNILLVIGIYWLKKKGKLKKFSYIQSQLIIGSCFGAVACFASSFGVEVDGIIVNVRDAAPITAGLIFGPISGIVAGFIGGLYRALSILWNASEYTVVACTISTIVAGIAAALLRKLLFDDKRPTVTYAVGISIVLEVFHMLMIFVTNFNDATNAFFIVRQCTMHMIIANSISVGVSVFIVSLFDREFKFKKSRVEKGIADTFRIWLFVSIIIAFSLTSLLTFGLQSSMNTKLIENEFIVALTDAGTDISEESNENLLNIVYEVKEKYVANNDVDLSSLLETKDYEIKEINIVSNDGIIVKSSEKTNVGYDMRYADQSNEFLVLVNQEKEKTMVQNYRMNGNGLYRKYAAVTLDDGGFIQVGYDSEQFHNTLNEFVIKATKNRHVGAEGFLAVCDEHLTLITNNEYNGKHISLIGIKPNKEMLLKKQASQIYTTTIIDQRSHYAEEYIYVFAYVEGYCIIAAMPQSEATLMRDASMYLSLFMQVIIFAILFVLIFYLIKKIIVNNLHKINEDLSQITGGNLNVQVNVRTSEEFSSLSDDINSTVSTLKRYIAEAAARIDKELEYAKQIQLSALPKDFIDNEEYGINAMMIAAKEVGGDFYDFYKIDENHIAFLVADVSGKGIPAAMFMMTAKTIIKDLAESGLKANEILTRANAKLCENNESGMFVTAWIGILNVQTGLLQYANAGHNPPLIIKSNNEVEYLKTRAGFVLGGLESVKYKMFELQLEKLDRIFLYTDGVTEATDINQQLFSEDRLLSYMKKNKDLSLNKILNDVKENIDIFVGDAPQFDDITMLIFEYRGTNKLSVSKTFKAIDSELPNVLGLFEQELEAYECSMKNITTICVAVEEIFVNIAHYAYKDEIGDCKVTLEFNKKSRELTIIIEDNGTPFNPLTKKDPDISLSAEDRQIGGLGIYIVKKTMDNVSYKYENETNVLTMKKNI